MNDNTLYVRKNGGEVTIANFRGCNSQMIIERMPNGVKEMRSPLVKCITYNEEKHVFYLEDSIPFMSGDEETQTVNVFFNMDENFTKVGEVYNDYFDSIGGLENLDKCGNTFSAYEEYKARLECEIKLDKEKRKTRHKENQEKFILSLVKREDVNES